MLTKELRDQTTRSGSVNSNMRRTSSSRCNEASKKEAWSSREDGTTDDRRKMKEQNQKERAGYIQKYIQ